MRVAGQPHRSRPQPRLVGGICRVEDFGKAPRIVVLALLVADHRQIEQEQRVALGLFAAPQAAVYFGTHRSVLVAGQQDIEEGEQDISFEALHECGPPVGEDRS